MICKKQMNFNSIFGNRYTQNRNEHLFESNCFNHQEFNAHFKREGNQEPNNTNLRRKTKGQEFNLNIENISEYYCTCGNSSQYEEQIEPLNQFVINNFCNCNEIITNKAELSTLKRIQHTHHNFPQIYQESELYWNRDNKLQGLEVECKVNQHFNSETKNLKMLTDRRSILISSFQQALVSQQIDRRLLIDRQVLGSKITKRNMKYFEELRNYDYTLETRVDEESRKRFTVYICTHSSGCRREFERPWNLLDHIRIHYDVRPHFCRLCNLRFTQKGNLNKHMLTHLKNLQRETLNDNQEEDHVDSMVRTFHILNSSKIKLRKVR